MADPVTLGAIAIGGGAILNSIGEAKSLNAQADAAEQNALYFEEQANNIALSAAREEDIFIADADQIIGQQLNAYAAAGISLQGSPMMKVQSTIRNAEKEVQAIRTFAMQNVRLSSLRADQANKSAENIRDAIPLVVAGNVLSGAGKIVGSA